MFPVRFPDLRIPYMAGCGLRIPAVGEIIVVVSSDDGHTVRPGGVKTGGVKAVGLASQQHSVQAVGLQHTGNFFEMIHSRSSFSESRGISGVTEFHEIVKAARQFGFNLTVFCGKSQLTLVV